MIERTGLLTLRELVLEYPVILMDSCVLDGDYSSHNLSKREDLKEKSKFYELVIRNYIEEGIPFFITTAVSEEYVQGHFPYGKLIKKKDIQRDRGSLDLMRKIKESEKERRRIVGLFESEGRVIGLSEDERNRHESLKNTPYGLRCYKLGKVDGDLLISGAVLSETRGPTCLASNDFGIYHQWKDLLNSNGFRREQLGFAIRMGLNGFKLLDNNYNGNHKIL